MKEINFKEYKEIFKALSDEARLKIIFMLKNGKTCACKILEEFHFTQPTLSYHMKLLCDSKIILAEKQGKWVHYSINNEQVKSINEFIESIKCSISAEMNICK